MKLFRLFLLSLLALTLHLSANMDLAIPNLNYISTEKPHPDTATLSQTMHQNTVQGLTMLHAVDSQVLQGFELFKKQHLVRIKQLVFEKLASSGRCFFIGSGSSGRIAIDIASKYSTANMGRESVIGIIAGGDSAYVRAREGFEDSESEGKSLVASYGITSNDCLILISASGSAHFNIGCAKGAKEAGATVCYFYNSTVIPANTQALFTESGVVPFLIDIGPQAITGSTRLQAASLAELCLGSIFSKDTDMLAKALQEGNRKIEESLQDIAKIVQLEHMVFSSPQANFRRLKDETSQGYVTFFAEKDSLREVVMDTVEITPTFSTNPPRKATECGKKMAEFQTYLINEEDNLSAWSALLGRKVHPSHIQDAEQFDITEKGLVTTIPLRPLGEGNLVIGVAKNDPNPVIQALKRCKKKGAHTALIVLSDEKIEANDSLEFDAVVHLEEIQKDSLGLAHTLLLKQVLNLISNSSMILMNKVDGNRMIDVSPSNKKLIDRTMRLVRDVFCRHHCPITHNTEDLYTQINFICEQKKKYELQNRYTPSVVKIAVTILQRKLNFEEAVEFLHANQEQLEKVFTL